MKYKTTDEINHFDFSDAHISEIRTSTSAFTMTLDQVIIQPENSCNRDIRQMRANQLLFRIENAEHLTVIEEGYKVYDVNGNLQKQEPDRTLSIAEYKDAFEQLADCTIYSIEKKDSHYEISIDTEDHTFLISMEGTQNTQEWDRFLNVGTVLLP